jgi:bacteriorhodopsin
VDAAAAAPPFTKQMFSNSRSGDDSHSGYTAANEASTGAGAFKLPTSENGDKWPFRPGFKWKDAEELAIQTGDVDAGQASLQQIQNVAVLSVRSQLTTAAGFYLFAMGVASIFAFWKSYLHHDYYDMFSNMLGAIICLVAAMHYKWITAIRVQSRSLWMTYGAPQMMPYNEQGSKEIYQELYVDAIRHSDWIITLPLLVAKYYHLIGRTGNAPFQDEEAAMVVAAVMVAAGFVIRVGTDEGWNLWNSPNCLSAIIFSGLFLGAVACLVCLLNDLLQATWGWQEGAPKNNAFFVSTFMLWIGYPVVYLISVIARGVYKGKYPMWLSIFKDVAYGFLDVYCKGFLAMWCVWDAFDKDAFGSRMPAKFDFSASPPPPMR